MRSPVTSRRICPCRNVFPAPMACFRARVYLYRSMHILVNNKSTKICKGRLGGQSFGDVRFGASAPMATGFSEQGMLLIVCAHGSHGNNLPNRWMQERLAPGTCRAEAVRAALYAGAGDELRGDAPRDRLG